MAQFVNYFAYLTLVFGLSFPMQSTTGAQNFPDPTKPPVSILHAGSVDEMPSGPVLQSILISAHRKIAIIDGQAVRLNGRFGSQTLVRMTESEVVLKRGKQLQTLRLHPDLSKEKIRASAK